MKNFKQFVTEAVETSASAQAKRMGLIGDGHGDWYDKQGKLIAKTVGGKLKIFGGGGAPKKEEEDTPKAKTQEPAKKQTPAQETPKQEAASGAVVVFGRFNPPTVGHEKLLRAAATEAKRTGYELAIYPSRTQDSKKNPLDPGAKINYMKKMFPDYAENIINDDEMKSIFNVLTTADEGGYRNINIIVGSDRQSEFENLATKYNGDLYNFENIRVISAGVRDADAEGVEGMSASKMRKAVVDSDFDAFRRGTPKSLDDGDTQALFDLVRQGMGIKAKKKEVEEMWQIAPKCDPKGLRDNYVSGNIFNIGDIVESLNTGLIGKIIRRGTNHLICLTREDYMFKSWIRDVNEAIVNYPGPSGVPSNQREIGTDSFRKYAMRMTGTFDIHNFINKYKKKTR